MFPRPAFISTNGIDMAVYEAGSGPAVILLHGFPEIAFSWRHQLPALAKAGFRAIAPDMRGYGRTTVSANVEDYCADNLIDDVCGMLDALELERAIFVGHDWGALLLWQMAMLRPARIEKLVILNIPHLPRSAEDPIALMRARFGDDYYIVHFQDSDEADIAFASDVRSFIGKVMRRLPITRERFEAMPPQYRVVSLLKTLRSPTPSGSRLLDDAELDYYTAAFERSGFRGAIHWYRNWTRNWLRLEGVSQRIDTPTLFIGAVDDVLIAPHHIEAMKPLVSDLTIHMLEDCGHWSQQEKPAEVNRLIVDWLVQRR